MYIISYMLPFFIILVIIYFTLIKPQQKAEKALQKVRADLKKGDKVITVSGILGEVYFINDDEDFLIITSEGSRLKMRKYGIAGKIEDEDKE